MPDPNCSVADCFRSRVCRGFCAAHYDRLRKHGSPLADVPLKPLPRRAERDDVAARILSRCERQPNGCITWTGPTLRGYARIRWQGRDWQAHRAIWTATVGPIPDDDDWTVDHLCRNRACQNVKHMEIVTRTENTERGGGLYVAQARNPRRPACKKGHLYAEQPPRRRPDGSRVCTVCKSARWRAQAQERNRLRRQAYRLARDCEKRHEKENR